MRAGPHDTQGLVGSADPRLCQPPADLAGAAAAGADYRRSLQQQLQGHRQQGRLCRPHRLRHSRAWHLPILGAGDGGGGLAARRHAGSDPYRAGADRGALRQRRHAAAGKHPSRPDAGEDRGPDEAAARRFGGAAPGGALLLAVPGGAALLRDRPAEEIAAAAEAGGAGTHRRAAGTGRAALHAGLHPQRSGAAELRLRRERRGAVHRLGLWRISAMPISIWRRR